MLFINKVATLISMIQNLIKNTHPVIVAVALTMTPFLQAAENGKPAPGFELKGINAQGKQDTYKLEQFKGKWVVLEWTNPECPFVMKHYHKSGNLPKIQKTYTDKGVVWLSVLTGRTAKKSENEISQYYYKDQKGSMTAILYDKDSKVGHAYDAKTTPHLYIVDPNSTLVYQGAIDDNSDTDADVIAKSKNFVSENLDAALAKKALPHASTKPYGCSVKY